jgi:hypothetical protein
MLSNVQLLSGETRQNREASRTAGPLRANRPEVNGDGTDRTPQRPIYPILGVAVAIRWALGTGSVRVSVMNKIHFWLIGFGIAGLTFEYIFDFPFGAFGIGLPFSALALGIRQWFMADAHAERIDSAFSNKGVGAGYDKYHYHDL